MVHHSVQQHDDCAVFGAGTRVSSYGVDNVALSPLSAHAADQLRSTWSYKIGI